MLLFIVTLINTLKGGCCLETGYLGYSFVPSFIHSKHSLLSVSPLQQPNSDTKGAPIFVAKECELALQYAQMSL